MSNLNLHKKLSERRGKRPNPFLYKLLLNVVGKPLARKMKLEVIDNVGVNKIKGPFIVLSNHTSRCDWQYVATAFGKHQLNFIASELEFHRAHLHFIFDLMHVIPKKNFVVDIHMVREIYDVIKKGGNIAFFPEGKSSISGTNMPVIVGTGPILKKLKLPVYTTTISGGYLSNTQWYIRDRVGKVQVRINKLFDPEDFENFTPEEIDSKVNAAIYNDDFDWNQKMRVQYKGYEDIAHKLEEHLFLCPKCQSELTMHGEMNVFKCSACGNGVTINSYGDIIPLDKNCRVPKNLRIWYELQRRKIYREIKNDENYCIETEVTLGVQPDNVYVPKTKTALVCGEGIVRVTRKEFAFIGTKNGEHFEIHEPILNMYTSILPTDSSYFGAYFGGVYHEFTPLKPIATKFYIAIEECHRTAGGVWKNTLPAQQWIYKDDLPTDEEEYFQKMDV